MPIPVKHRRGEPRWVVTLEDRIRWMHAQEGRRHLRLFRGYTVTRLYVRQRVFDYLDLDSRPGCWIWTGQVSRKHGTPGISLRRNAVANKYSARKAVWWAFIDGDYPIWEAGAPHLLSACPAGDPLCVHPAHLRLETPKVREERARDPNRRGVKITGAQAAQIRLLHSKGYGYARLRRATGLALTTVAWIVTRRTWRDIEPAQELDEYGRQILEAMGTTSSGAVRREAEGAGGQ